MDASEQNIRRFSRITLTVTALLAASASVQAAPGPKGSARRWESALPAGTYGLVTLRTGRLLTTLPLVGWNGRGPAIQMNLYHNMNSNWGPLGVVLGDANADSAVNANDIDPFIDIVLTAPGDQTGEQLAVADLDSNGTVDESDLGVFLNMIVQPPPAEPCSPDWRTSYSSRIVPSTNGMQLIRDDGTSDFFTWNGDGSLTAPAGVWDTLIYNGFIDGNDDSFTLTSKHQWKSHYVFNEATPDWYRLDWISDAARYLGQPINNVNCEYGTNAGSAEYGKLKYVRDATVGAYGRRLELVYNSQGRVKAVTAPLTYNSGTNTWTYRTWKLLYADGSNPNNPPSQDGAGALVAVEDPMGYRTAWTYDGLRDIASMADKNGSTYTFTYYNGRLDTIHDPAPFQNQSQVFSYYRTQNTNNQFCQYTDRRGKWWHFKFDWSLGHLTALIDPLGPAHTQTLGYQAGATTTKHEPTSYTSGFGETWHMQYDSRGNPTYLTDATGSHQWIYEYDSVNNNLLTIKPPSESYLTPNENKAVRLKYGDSNNPTSVTEIDEAGTALSPEAVTTLTYYTTESGIYGGNYAFGLLKKVVPPFQTTSVPTNFCYDQWGQLSQASEGADVCGFGVSDSWARNAAGCMIYSGDGISCPVYTFDPDDPCSVASVVWGPCSGAAASGNEVLTIYDGRPRTCPAPGQFGSYPYLKAGFFTARGLADPPDPNEKPYTPMGEPKNVDWSITEPFGADGQPVPSYTRREHFEFDPLGQLRVKYLKSSEATGTDDNSPQITRTFAYEPHWTTGEFKTTGPDNQIETVTTDDAGRAISFTRVKDGQTIISATTTYYNDDAVDTVTYGNNTRTRYGYDTNRRVNMIAHERLVGTTWQNMHKLDYVWTADGLVLYILETDETSSVSWTQFGYDNRNRLTGESRSGEFGQYFISYNYDKAGNRVSKTNSESGDTTLYHYDVDNQSNQTRGNRLMWEERHHNGAQGPLLEQRWYEYDIRGRTSMVIRRIAGDVDQVTGNQWNRGTRLYYDTKGFLWLAVAEQWQIGIEGDPGLCERTAAMEYRYDGGRGRYMVRPRDPSTLLPTATNAGTWSDYDLDDIWGDYSVDSSASVSCILSHSPGPAQAQYSFATNTTNYLHANFVETAELMTGPGASSVGRAVFSAFGESMYSAGVTNTRYRYCGAWGYGQPASGDPLADLGWLHVGARYYDASSGRFQQRDPIGIEGGPNAYAYMENNPTDGVDPDGMDRWWVYDTNPILTGGLLHEAIFVQVTPTSWVRIDFGPGYSGPNVGKNIKLTFAKNPRALLRPTDVVVGTRKTSLAHDRKTISKALIKYNNKRYWLIGRNCKNVARKLFHDRPPVLPPGA